MRKLTDDELRFLLHLGVQRLPKSLLQSLQRGTQANRDRALNVAVDVLLGQLSRIEAYAPDPLKNHG